MEKLRPEEPERITPLDELARRGHFKEGDLPGTDTYDDGLEGGVLKPGSTVGESVGTYMEDKGPVDMVQRPKHEDEALALDAKLSVGESAEFRDEQEGDEADRWLRENDPKWGQDKAL